MVSPCRGGTSADDVNRCSGQMCGPPSVIQADAREQFANTFGVDLVGQRLGHAVRRRVVSLGVQQLHQVMSWTTSFRVPSGVSG